MTLQVCPACGKYISREIARRNLYNHTVHMKREDWALGKVKMSIWTEDERLTICGKYIVDISCRLQIMK